MKKLVKVQMGVYRHFADGQEYELFEVAEEYDTGKQYAVFRSSDGHVFVLESSIFFGKIDKTVYKKAEQDECFKLVRLTNQGF